MFARKGVSGGRLQAERIGFVASTDVRAWEEAQDLVTVEGRTHDVHIFLVTLCG